MSSLRSEDVGNIDALLKAAELLEQKMFPKSAYDTIERVNNQNGVSPDSFLLTVGSYRDWFASRDLTKNDSQLDKHVVSELQSEITSLMQISASQKFTDLNSIRNNNHKHNPSHTFNTLNYIDGNLVLSNTSEDSKSPSMDISPVRTGGWMCSNRLEAKPRSRVLVNGLNQFQMLTAASGINQLHSYQLGLEDEPDELSNASEDVCIDTSSQDSFSGNLTLGHPSINISQSTNISGGTDFDAHNHRSSQNRIQHPNIRLRSALLTPSYAANVFSNNSESDCHISINHTISKIHNVNENKQSILSVNETDLQNTPESPEQSNTFLTKNLMINSTSRDKISSLSFPKHKSWSAPPSVSSINCTTPEKEVLDVSLSLNKTSTGECSRSVNPVRPLRFSCSNLPVKKRRLDWKQLTDTSSESNFYESKHPPSSAPPVPSSNTSLFADTTEVTKDLINTDHPATKSNQSSYCLLSCSKPLNSPAFNKSFINHDDCELDYQHLDRRPHSIPGIPSSTCSQNLNEFCTSAINHPQFPMFKSLPEKAGPILTDTTDNSELITSNSSKTVDNIVPIINQNSAPNSKTYCQNHYSVLARTLAASNNDCINSVEQRLESNMINPTKLCLNNEILNSKHLFMSEHDRYNDVPKSTSFRLPQNHTLKYRCLSNQRSNSFNNSHNSSNETNGDIYSYPVKSSSSLIERKSHNGLIKDKISSHLDSIDHSHTLSTDRSISASQRQLPDKFIRENSNPRSVIERFSPEENSNKVIRQLTSISPVSFVDKPHSDIPEAVEAGTIRKICKISTNSPSPNKNVASAGLLVTKTSPLVSKSTSTLFNTNSVSKSPILSNQTSGAQVIMMLSPTEASNPILSSSGKSNLSNVITNNPVISNQSLNYSVVHGLNFNSHSTSGSFPLLLVSAPSSASAAAMAAAAALATGAPPTSLVPVPVQVTTYVPSDDKSKNTNSTSHYLSNTNRDIVLSTENQNQRIILSVIPDDKLSNAVCDEKKTPLILSAPIVANFAKQY